MGAGNPWEPDQPGTPPVGDPKPAPPKPDKR